MRKKIKLTIYSGEIPSTTFIERLITGLSNREEYIIFLLGSQKKKIQYESNNIKVKSYSPTLWGKFLFLIKYSILLYFFRNQEKKKLDRYIKTKSPSTRLLKIKYYPVLWHKPDIFHLQWVKSVEDWIWVKDFGIRLIVSLRGAHINYSPITIPEIAQLYYKNFPLVDGFHAVSDAIGVEAQKYGADPTKIKTVYSGLPLENIPDYKFFPKEGNTFKILSIGRAHWVKGYSYALDCMKILSEKGFDFHYTIIGTKDVEELEFQINDLNIQNVVTLIDRLPYQKVLEMILQSDLILLPSVEEGIANVILEGMMLKKLVLTTNCGGMQEIIQNAENGFIVPNRDSKAMADKIIEISQLTDSQIKQITNKAFQTIQNTNSEVKMVETMDELYKQVLSH